MSKYFLVKGDVVIVIRKEHHGNPHYWLVCSAEQPAPKKRLYYVNADWCTPLDPAFNVLFERKKDE